MSSMYTLPLNFPNGTKVDPIGVMYKLNSYHDPIEDTSSIPSIHSYDPTKQLEYDQVALIKLLEQLSVRLDKHLLTVKKEGKEEKKKMDKVDSKPVKDKGSKAPPKGDKTKNVTVSNTPWKVVEDKSPAEANNGIVASAKPTLESFPIEKISKGVLTVSSHDIFWVESLAKVAAVRGFELIGEVKNGGKNVNGSIQVNKGDVVSFKSDSINVNGRMNTMKVIGSILGLFSFDSFRCVQSTHIHRWLIQLDHVIKCKKDSKEVSFLLRSSSQFLSRFDSLSTQSSLSLADIVIRPLFNGNLPNNVELWAKRLDSLL